MRRFLNSCYTCIIHPLKGYFTQLLASMILLFIFRPYARDGMYMAIWQFLLFVVFFSAIFNCNHSKKIKIISTCFALPAIIAQWINLFWPAKELAILFTSSTVIFIFITTSSIIKRVVLNARVRMETLRGVVCAYFMVAFGFAFLYLLVNLLVPNTFHIANFEPLAASHTHYLSEMMYFSFVTLLCIGYGDVIAVQDLGQTCAILEGIIGQFYIAILVSRLVAVYSFFEHKLHLVSKNKNVH